MSTLDQMTANVREELQEPTAGLWSDAELKRWLNRGAKALAREAQLQATTTITTAADDESYALPADFGYAERVEIETEVGSGEFRRLVALTIQDRTTDTGEPIGWTVWNGEMWFFPVPDGVYSIKVFYHRQQVTLGDADTPIISDEYHPVIELFAVAMAKRKTDDPAYATYASDFEAGRAQLIRDRNKRDEQDDMYPVIRETPAVVDTWDQD